MIQLTISGMNHNITINHRVKTLKISGNNNIINGHNPNCLINNIVVSGISNRINLNRNCINANRRIDGIQNSLNFDGVPTNSPNNMNMNMNMNINNPNMNRGFVRIINNYNNGAYQENYSYNNNDLNNLMNNLNNLNINANPNNMNQNPNNHNVNVNNNRANDDDDDDEENNNNNLSDFEKKKHGLFLEMDEYQYKHIERYGESRKETECAICLENFKGIDMIKSFYKCNHIFHKKCLKDWLKRSNTCPLCNHDLTEDINNQAH